MVLRELAGCGLAVFVVVATVEVWWPFTGAAGTKESAGTAVVVTERGQGLSWRWRGRRQGSNQSGHWVEEDEGDRGTKHDRGNEDIRD